MPRTLARNASWLATLATILLVAAVGLLTWAQFTSSREAQLWVRHTFDVIAATKNLDIAVRDAETGNRGFLLTGEDAFLAPYQAAVERIPALEAALRRLTADNPVQQDRLASVAILLQRKLDMLAQTSGCAAKPGCPPSRSHSSTPGDR